MGFLVYGNDSRTGEVAPRFYSNARTEADARLHGTERGLVVTAVAPYSKGISEAAARGWSI